jgi:hypothetical protein
MTTTLEENAGQDLAAELETIDTQAREAYAHLVATVAAGGPVPADYRGILTAAGKSVVEFQQDREDHLAGVRDAVCRQGIARLQPTVAAAYGPAREVEASSRAMADAVGSFSRALIAELSGEAERAASIPAGIRDETQRLSGNPNGRNVRDRRNAVARLEAELSQTRGAYAYLPADPHLEAGHRLGVERLEKEIKRFKTEPAPIVAPVDALPSYTPRALEAIVAAALNTLNQQQRELLTQVVAGITAAKV